MNYKIEHNRAYDPNTALAFFKLFGKLELIKEREKIFGQGEKAGFLSFWQTDKTYLLVEGSVTIQMESGTTIPIEQGEIFGEFTPYAASNATAIADSSCKLISLSEKQLLSGLKKQPEFLFMLMDVLVKHLQVGAENSKDNAENKSIKKDCVLSSKMLNTLKEKLGETALTVVPEKRVVFQKGAAASVMYVILDGYMSIIVGDKVVGRSGPGDIVGEIGLVVQYARTASVIAETRCYLLAINRQTLIELIQTLPSFGISVLRVLASR